MKKILVMSDTHGNKRNIARAVSQFSDIDCIIHLGDNVRDAEYVRRLAKKKVYSVKGNCDIASTKKSELIINMRGKKILALHGHRQGVKYSLLRLSLYARQKGVDIALFGHTHVPAERLYEGVYLYNPGSLGDPRGRKPTVGIISIDNGDIKISTHKLLEASN